MSSASAVKKSTKVAAKETAPVVAPATTTAVKAKKGAAPAVAVEVKVEKKVVEKKVVEKAPAAEGKKPRAKKEAAPVAAVEEEKQPAAPRVPPTSESVQNEVADLISGLTTAKLNELENVKAAVKLLKATASRLKHLRNDLTRVLRKTKREHAPKDKSKLSNSGLMKPVSISKELAAFMGVDASTLHSRVSVTNAICTYIKEKNLQNPKNKREIVPDDSLVKLLHYKAGAQPLTYFYIQQLIQPHFLKEISGDLAQFMNVSASSLQSSQSVLQSVTTYANSKGLVHGSDVNLDDKLGKLLGKSGTVPVQALGQLVKSHFKK
jgi:chromatin remodeling complex protein RSC6